MSEEQKEVKREDEVARAIDDITGEDGMVQDPIEVNTFRSSVVSINDFPEYVPEEENENILVKGRWLERGGSAWWISTAGTGKSIASVQLAYRWGAGLEFAGLVPHRPLRTWIVQSEDSPSRIVIDREDITAELKEATPEVDWPVIGRECVKFVKISGKVGTAFLDALDSLLALAQKCGEMPDVVQINPFMAFVGGPVTDGGYVTPFLRGGEIGHDHTDGLQALLEKYNVAALIFHHTPKPPTEKELDGWLKSTFPEYQGAGSSDITNWGRSFITMMKVKGHGNMVCMMAGKNGNEIGWENIGGSRRRYMAWSNGTGITGGLRHAWRELDEAEYSDIVEKQLKVVEEDADTAACTIADVLKKKAMKLQDIESGFLDRWRRSTVRLAVKMITERPEKYHLTIVQKCICNRWWTKFVGLAEGARALADETEKRLQVDSILAARKRVKKQEGDENGSEGEGSYFTPF